MAEGNSDAFDALGRASGNSGTGNNPAGDFSFENGNDRTQDGTGGSQGASENGPGSVGSDPNAAAGPEPATKRRGRRRLTDAEKAARAAERTRAKTAGVAVVSPDQIQGLHTMLAMLLKQPILQIEEHEAVALSASMNEVANHYGISFGGNPLIGLCVVCGMIYYPRLMAMRQQQRQRTARGQGEPTAASPRMAVVGGIDFSGDIPL